MLNLPAIRKALGSLLICVLGTIMLGASPDSAAKKYNRVGGNLMCVCSCGQQLLQCNHVGCPDSGPMLGELHDQLAGPNGAGADSLILNWFVAKYGATVLAAPIRGGFDTVAWIVPLSVFGFAIFGTAWLVRQWSARRRILTADTPEASPPTDELRERIRRETEY